MPIYPAAVTFPSRYLTPGGLAIEDLDITATLDPARWTALLDLDRWTATLEADVPRTIKVTAGDSAYVSALLTDSTGSDLTGVTYQVSLGTYTAPGSWVTPDVITVVSASSRRVKVVVGTGKTIAPAPGVFYLWVRVTSNPELESVQCRNDRVTIL